MFRSLSGVNYRIWFAGALVSNIGTWMQRTAQDWIVLTQLTNHNAAAVGIVMALQFGPQLLLLPWSGLIADRFDRRKLLILTQTSMGALALGLGLITVLGVVELWHVYLFAFALGVVSAIDAPARQAFVGELVNDDNMSNAVALNSASFNGARLIGPAVAGVLTAAVGAGWVFLINAVTFAFTVLAMFLLRKSLLRVQHLAPRARGQLLAGFRYVRGRPDIIVVLIVVFLVGTFGFNFAIFTSTMTTVVFGLGASEFGLLSSIMAIGSVAGALLSAQRPHARLRLILIGSAAFGITCGIAAFMPSYGLFAAALILVGFSSLTLMTTANAYVQTTTEPSMRGRVMALYMAIFAGGTPLGAPLVGWVADEFGPRWAVGVAAASGVLAAAAILIWMIKYRGLRLRYRPRVGVRLELRHLGDGRALTGTLSIVATKEFILPTGAVATIGETAVEGPERLKTDADAIERETRETATESIAVVEATTTR
ncbi:MFS transporter [Glaciibacter psychrotolerans]|uniref:MFS family permease n=2 Tax=Glaciibacter psychrotolerans TaxID=670054 RepID=A0A7Z0J732_9MICO|nr:MFS family permease [Leifsonia psychrotolerans]